MSASASPATARSAPTASTAASTASEFSHPMLAALGDGVGQLAVEQPRGDQAAAVVGADRVQRGDVGVAMAEGDGPVGMFARRLDQPVAVAACPRG